MPKLLFVSDFNEIRNEIRKLSGDLSHWHIQSVTTRIDINRIEEIFLQDGELHFLIFSKSLNPDTLHELQLIKKKMPLLQVLFYSPSLNNRQFARLYEAGITCCIIGENRLENLIQLLEELWERHWKRIPDSILRTNRSDLSARAKKILEYIENKPLRDFNINAIAHYLELSESHFRAEFKNTVGMSFREFKQKLFFHYESVLLFRNKLKPIEIFTTLDYKNLSAFSRSFKARHGLSWRKFKYGSKELN